MKVDLLRLILPPFQSGTKAPLRCAWRTSQDGWQSAAHDDPAAVSRLYQARRIEACPHPADVAMAEVALPPLPAGRRRVAVLGALEPLALTPPESLAVGFGARAADGRVPVAWADATPLRAALRELRRHGILVRAVYPPPAFLPYFDSQTAAALRIDDWIIVRTGIDAGWIYPLVAHLHDAAQIARRVQGRLPDGVAPRWLEEDAAASPAPAAWRGEGWPWPLSVMDEADGLFGAGWPAPAAGWACVAAAIWLAGLGLYAARTDAEGRALNRALSAQVKAAFPEISVVINPLQQARQLRDARRGGAQGASADFPTLLRAAADLLPQADGQVQTLEYREGELRFRLRAGAAFSGDALRSLREPARERGLAISADADGLLLKADAGAGAAP
ncbi:type II secretion system protein GspL [Brenneria populi subsp. brevivirga]|uniref:type II secretion system protein GspL n=1 Tax=Brenneria populi TaxID=1505588 RepID=UPI002E19D794|nr:type II secretion system protein GspL [Brenneria populi subsp. brevivirga]